MQFILQVPFILHNASAVERFYDCHIKEDTWKTAMQFILQVPFILHNASAVERFSDYHIKEDKMKNSAQCNAIYSASAVHSAQCKCCREI